MNIEIDRWKASYQVNHPFPSTGELSVDKPGNTTLGKIYWAIPMGGNACRVIMDIGVDPISCFVGCTSMEFGRFANESILASVGNLRQDPRQLGRLRAGDIAALAGPVEFPRMVKGKSRPVNYWIPTWVFPDQDKSKPLPKVLSQTQLGILCGKGMAAWLLKDRCATQKELVATFSAYRNYGLNPLTAKPLDNRNRETMPWLFNDHLDRVLGRYQSYSGGGHRIMGAPPTSTNRRRGSVDSEM